MTACIGEIRLWAGDFTPSGWIPCDGRLVQRTMYLDLYSVIGTTYGGDSEYFGVPDLRGQLPIHQGTGPGLSPRTFLESVGTEEVTLTASQLPLHGHQAMGVGAPAVTRDPSGSLPAVATGARYRSPHASTEPSLLDPRAVEPAGGGQPHENRMPFLTLTFILAAYGILPSPT